MKRIWWNHWFSTAYRLIELMNKDKEYHIIGSNDKDWAVYQEVCDEFYVEPEYVREEYLDYCLNFCKVHKVDVFVPRRGMELISKNVEKFEALGVKVLVEYDYSLMSLLNDKYETAQKFKELSLCEVPDIKVVNNVEEFKSAYSYFKEKYPNKRFCIKYSRGEGATSFRVIDDGILSIKSLDKGPGTKLSYDQVVNMLSGVETFDDLMVMPYLEGLEVSIDSIMTSKGFVAVSRYKMGSRYTKIEHSNELTEIARNVAEKLKLTRPFNLQLKYSDGIPYLLEINTRMAGGTHQCAFAGLNVPYLAIKTLLNEDFEFPSVLKETASTHIETPIEVFKN